MIITGIESRRKSLCAIYIDGEEAVCIDKETTFAYRLQPGTEIDDTRLHEIILESDRRRAKEKALWLISYRDYSSKELSDKLLKDYSKEAVDGCIEKLFELGLIDDERFARRYAKDLFEVKKLSASGAKYKLLEKGIDKDLIREIIEEYSDSEGNRLKKLLDTKYFRNMFDEKGRKRVIAALQRGGYRWSDIKSAFAEFDDENEYSAETEDNIYG